MPPNFRCLLGEAGSCFVQLVGRIFRSVKGLTQAVAVAGVGPAQMGAVRGGVEVGFDHWGGDFSSEWDGGLHIWITP